MNRFLGTVAVIALTGMAGAAMADTTKGIVKSVDSARHMVTLASGQTFELGTGIKSADLKPGDQIAIEHHFYQKGYPLAEQITMYKDGRRMGLSSTTMKLPAPVADNQTSGVVASVDSARHMVTLASGQTFELGTGIKSADLNSGDRIVIEHDFYQKGYPLAEQITKFKENGVVVLPGQMTKPRL